MGLLETGQVFHSFDTLFSFTNQDVAVAVSGGSDSMGLLLLLSDWCKVHNLNLRVVSVNHQLRQEARKECEFVAHIAEGLGWTHQTLYWKNDGAEGNLSLKAREGRYRVISEWCLENGIEDVFLGHTMNDQAESVLMELKRKAGVDGLSAMPRTLSRFGVTWIRPLLDYSRVEIQEYLRANNQEWILDPSNEDSQRTRIQFRNLMPELEEIGITAEGLSRVASNLQKTRQVVQYIIREKAEEMVSVSEVGEYVLVADYWELPEEIREKLFARIIQFLSGDNYRPRQSAVNNCLTRASAVNSATISNFVVQKGDNNCVRIFSDPKKRADPVDSNQLWNNRWRVSRVPGTGLRLGMLSTQGYNKLNLPINKEITHGALLASPALWTCNNDLVETIFNDFGTSAVFEDTKNKEAFLLFIEGN
ncbi:MAG: tRNA lysidine(34) synthetase TilS [Rhodobacteraceae bacterium]|nr:tRNA lysidine(34) synthetase TilS [Paracoccaceae bacterium]